MSSPCPAAPWALPCPRQGLLGGCPCSEGGEEGAEVLSAPGASLGQGRFWLDWPVPARYQHLPMATLSGLIGAEGVRRLNCSCPSKESESYWSRSGGEPRGGSPARVRPTGRQRRWRPRCGLARRGWQSSDPSREIERGRAGRPPGRAAPSGQPHAARARRLCRAAAMPATAPLPRDSPA